MRYPHEGRTVDLVDARGRAHAALAEVRSRARHGETLLVLTDDAAIADDFLNAGAFAFLAAPRDEAEIAVALRYARRAGMMERRELADVEGDDAARVQDWLAQQVTAKRPCALIVVALSRLDLVNAAHGRDRVDAATAQIAGRIMTAAGPHAFVIRVGGARFLVGLGGDWHPALAAIGTALARPFDVDGGPMLLGNRVGVAEHEGGEDVDTLVRRAGDALAQARISDGATTRVAGPEDAGSLDELAADLHHAITGGDIGIVFQPQVEIASGCIVGVEALARWEHPRLGPLGADTLFAAADRADLGIALSDHIQQLTLARAARWPRVLDALRLSLNLTAADVARAGFARLFLDRVDASGFPRGRLTVEITETGMIQELDRAASILTELRGAGCRIAIDDFGTGYSSLAYLKALPLDYLKIDKALARDITGNPRDRVVVRGVIEIARALGLAVIAEGVETPQQLALLAAEGCGWYQGFLRSGALDETALAAMVEKER
ncbi:hypothetical protein ASG67_05905 [Sphingomonas sp. Leaf339]|uniref:GGDEF domain-containing phosphodiesterase n=1 Tax=Sphingomonas sp. Leaf339 TaxID=1736343 RepID=UPI0006F89E5B|nr:GGDEF domain-containing phosphodiesterase [Sphingomonas sp. Leaf339]KQU55671.1 hypothetical protein ASG67_05905 [Sphingomonas sp. Leaf339]